MRRSPDIARPRAAWRAGAALVLALVLNAAGASADDEPEKLPKLPGDDKANSLPLPTPEQIEKMAGKYQEKASSWKTYAEKAAKRIREQGIAAVGDFTRETAVIFAAIPECALVFNKASFEATPMLYLRGAAWATEHYDRCLTVSMALGCRAQQTDDILLAAALGRLAHAWGRLLVGESVSAARVKAAAELVHPPAGASRVDEGAWQSFVVSAAGADARQGNEAVTAWAAEEAKRLAAGGDEGIARRVETATALGRAIGLAVYEEKSAADALGAALAPLAAAEALSNDDFALVNLYNRAVTEARGLKAAVKADYRFDARTTASGLIQFKVPRATGWSQAAAGSDQQMDGTWIRSRGILNETTLRVWKYSVNTNYVDPSGKKIGGDNVGARMKQFFDDDKASVGKVKKASPSIGKLSKTISPLKGYEVRGEDSGGFEKWYREWYFKPARSKDYVLNVSLRREGMLLVDDAEIEFILDSMTEPPK